VATRVGGVEDLVVHGQTGLLCEPDNVDALAAALIAILRDGAGARAMGVSGRAKALETYDADHVAERHHALYRRRAVPYALSRRLQQVSAL
jgi:glycosyltransferase involved in cell wall biosynthesis